MIRAFRRTSLASVVVAVALFATMPATISSLLHSADDALCDDAIVVHDPNAHQVSSETQPTEPQHCVLCHALQSLRAVQASVRIPLPRADFGNLSVGSSSAVQVLVAATRPARAPPSA